MKTPQRVSIVMEWENVASSAEGRVVHVLAALAQQAGQLATASRDGQAAPPLALPIELLVLFNPEVAVAADVESAVRLGLGPCAAIEVRIIPTPGLDYFQMKNHGARLAHGDLVVLLDSDVIPQPGWLSNLLGSFADSSVEAVASRAFVKPDSLYAKTVSLTWLFSPSGGPEDLRPSSHFHANGAAFRRHIILDYPYPPTPGQSRGAGHDLRLQLRQAGITVYEQGSAWLDHPPPSSLWNYCRRAVTHGSDDLHSIRRRKGARRASLGRSAERAFKKWLRGIVRLVRDGRQVGLSPLALPAAAALVSLYYACYFAGDVQARLWSKALYQLSPAGSGGLDTESSEITAELGPHGRRLAA